MGDLSNGDGPDLAFLAKKYEEEKLKRLRSDGNDQYVDLDREAPPHLARLVEDPWVDHDALNAQPPNLKDGDDIKFLMLGAGFCGLLYGARFIEAGFKADDIRLVDVAGGFGGTWYWNRYPGLMCDSESYMYLPLVEDLGYMPKNRYASGDEIREHAERIAKHYNLTDKGVFRTAMETFNWDDDQKRWIITLNQNRGPKEEPIQMTIKAQFVVIANGVLNHPKTPKIDGIEGYEGAMIHTARWNYDISGGSPTDIDLTGLKDKKVGFIGTGATGVQCVTALAQSAGHLYVFQRTPSAVDERGQRETDPEEWAKISAEPGWWLKRNVNFLEATFGNPPEGNLVNDAWTTVKTYHILVGKPREKPLAFEDIPDHISASLALDAPRGERLRKRVEDIVEDKETAEKLKAWYPSWCKRPCFHDGYLPTFNRPNVTLVQTEPTGVGKAYSKGLVVDGKEYDLDVLVFGTGYRAPGISLGDPSQMCNATITGRDGRLMSEKWAAEGTRTLHGCLSNGFPNLMLTGPGQAGSSPNFTFLFDIMSRHMAETIAAAAKRSADPDRLVIEPTKEAEAAWTGIYQAGGLWAAPVSICLPSYINNEGAPLSQEEAGKAAGGGGYPHGIKAYLDVLEEWRRQGDLEGLVVE